MMRGRDNFCLRNEMGQKVKKNDNSLLKFFPSVVLCSFIMVFSGSLGEPLQLSLCERWLSEFVYRMQRGALGFERDPLPEVIRRASAENGRFTEHGNLSPEEWVQEFHEDVLNFLIAVDKQPRKRWPLFEQKYGLTHEQAMDVLTYYVSRHYFNGLSYLGPPREVLARFSRVAREHRLADPGNEVSRTYLYYLHNVTRLSVPQMAEQLSKTRDRKISEQQIYRELSQAGISIEAEFETPLEASRIHGIAARLNEIGRGHLMAGVPRESLVGAANYLAANGRLSRFEIARVLNVGENALDFIQHHRNEISRGVAWRRNLDAEGRRLAQDEHWELEEAKSEGELLTLFWERDELSSQEIADRLNRLFRTSPESGNYRSQASVTAKAKVLGLTDLSPKGPDVELPPMGNLRRRGI
jgi:hypothetical protein